MLPSHLPDLPHRGVSPTIPQVSLPHLVARTPAFPAPTPVADCTPLHTSTSRRPRLVPWHLLSPCPQPTLQTPPGHHSYPTCISGQASPHRSPGRGQTPPSNMTGLSLPACSACGHPHLSYGSPTDQWHRPEVLGSSLAPHSSFHPYIKSTPGCLQVPPSSPPPSPVASLPGSSFHPTWPSSKPSGSHPTLTGISLSPTHQLKPPCYLHLVLHAVGSHLQVALGLQASAPWT